MEGSSEQPRDAAIDLIGVSGGMTTTVVLEASNNLPLGGSHSGLPMKRKTPSELRGEQLKRRNVKVLVDSSLPNSAAYERKTQSLKLPKYINTRVDEVYPVKKSSERCRVICGKDKTRDPSTLVEISDDLVVPLVPPAKAKPTFGCYTVDIRDTSKSSESSANHVADQGFRKIEKCSESALRNVVDLHLTNDKPSDSAKIDMDKALKSLVSREASALCTSSAVPSWTKDHPSVSSNISPSEFEIPGCKAPLDLTLKTSLRFISSFPVGWCHRLSASPAAIDARWFDSQFSYIDKKESNGCEFGQKEPIKFLFSRALHSWVYPQSSLPPSIVSMLLTSSLKGEMDFFLKRQRDWEDSFHTLYYMLRKGTCNIFYVFTLQFVVLFIGGNFPGKRYSCKAYLSRSTCGLRSLLRKHDISYEMPLCHTEAECAAKDDLFELSEIEKHNLGQAFHLDSFSDVDDTPQSLLSFIGNKNVHGLYDFLLNYRSFLSSFSGFDVPLLFAPVPFHNASLYAPEVRSKEVRKADMVFLSSRKCDKDENEALHDPYASSGICYSVEISGTIIPPWVVSRLCAAMSSGGGSFETRLATESSSIGLNVALESIFCKPDVPTESKETSLETGFAFGIPQAVLTPQLKSASLKRLKFSDGAYMVYSVPD